MKILCFSEFGGPEVLRYQDAPDPEPGPGEALVRTRAIGLNFADLYRRRGTYPLAGSPPYVAGYEAAGEIAALGPAVAQGAPRSEIPFRPGDRVAFADAPFANAELVRVPLDRLLPLPLDVTFETAAAVLLQGLTAQYLTRDSHRLRPGETVLIHAAAGGVGSLLVQVAKLLGARVMGLTSSPAKAARIRALRAEAVALYGDGWVEAARAFGSSQGSGAGVDVVYDSVGSTLADSFAAARPGGHVVFFGMAGGNPAPVDPRMLMDTSKSLTGGDLWNVLTSHHERLSRAHELFGWVRHGKLQVDVGRTFRLSEGAEAHRYLESRQSTGKVLLIP